MQALAAALAAAAWPRLARSAEDTSTMESASPARMPVLFLAHGSPFLLANQPWVDELAAWARALPRPRAILMISAHWENAPLAIGAVHRAPLIYDFYGFPAEFYRLQYPSPGAPELATRVVELLQPSRELVFAPERGLDHGAYVPLIAMYPEADIPVLQISLPSMDPRTLLAVGQELAPLRDEGVLIVGSGFLTHNLRELDPRPGAPIPAWARGFDDWIGDVLARQDVDALLDYRAQAPSVPRVLPTHEHFVPVIVAQGAAMVAGGASTFPILGWDSGPMTKRSVQYG